MVDGRKSKLIVLQSLYNLNRYNRHSAEMMLACQALLKSNCYGFSRV